MTNDQMLGEQSVIGAILIDPRSLSAASELLTAEDFVLEADRELFRAALALEREGRPIDPVILRDRVAKSGGEISMEYMVQLMDLTPTAANVREYARQVKEQSLRRQILDLAQNTIDRAKQMEAPTDILFNLDKKAEQLLKKDRAGDLIDEDEAARRFLEYREKLESGESKAFIPTGYRDLDEILGGGMLAGGMYILAARPGMGKTTLAINITDKVAKNHNRVLFYSLEMDIEQVQAKRYARASGIPGNKILMKQNLSEQETERLIQAVEDVRRLPVTINQEGNADMDKIKTDAKKVKDLQMIVIDYFGIIQPDKESKKYERYEAATKISGQVKSLARELGIPILLLAQLNRMVEGRSDKRPQLSDLRDTGAAEQDADGVLLLYREDYYEKKSTRDWYDPEEMEVIVAKNRHGSVGSCKLSLFLATSRVRTINKGPREAWRNSEAFRQQRMEDLEKEGMDDHQQA